MADFDDDFDGRRRGPGGRRTDGKPGGARPGGGRRERSTRARTEYCPEGKCFDYKDVDQLKRFIGETGKIKPRRQTGCCARCQRELAIHVKRARHLALLPFVDNND